jgi:hypothetical protein
VDQNQGAEWVQEGLKTLLDLRLVFWAKVSAGRRAAGWLAGPAGGGLSFEAFQLEQYFAGDAAFLIEPGLGEGGLV